MSTLPQRPSAQPGDSLGYRVLGFDKKTGDRLEMLRLRPQFSGQPAFEQALRDRLQRLAELRGPGFARVRQIDRLTGQASGVAVVSNHMDGVRLADLLQTADTHGVRVDIDAALCLLRQLVAAVANLHAAGPDISHGCLGPERLLVTPDARLIVTEYVLGPALESMQWTRERFWQEVRVALPAGADPATFDQRADILQIGLVALALISGRSIYAEKQYPLPLADRVGQAKETPVSGTPQPLSAALAAWLTATLQVDPATAFSSMQDTQAALDALIGDGYLAAPASVAAFVERCQQAAPPPEAATRDSAEAKDAGTAGDRPAAKARITQAFAQPFPAPAAPGSTVGATAKSGSTATGTSGTPLSTTGADAGAVGKPGAFPASPGGTSATTPAAARTGATGDAAAKFGAEAAKAGTAANGGLTLLKPDATRAAAAAKGAASAGARAALVVQQDTMVDDNTPLTEAVVAAGPPRVRKPYLITLGLAVLLAVGFQLVLRYANPFDGSPAQASVPTMMPSSAGVLTIDASPKAATVFIDNVARGTTPLKLELAAGTHSVRLDDGEGLTRSFPVTVTAGKELSHLVELARNAETGALDVRSDPAGARVSLDNKLVGMSPVTIADIVPGDHTILVEGPQGTVRQTVKVIAGTRASIVVPLAAAAGSTAAGWLTVTADQEIQVLEGGQVLGSSRADRIMMPAGSHDLDFTNDAMGFHVTKKVQVTAGKVTQLAIPLPDGAVSVNATPWAEVLLDGQRIGETPVGNFAAKPGTHELVFRHPKLGEKKQSVIVKPGQTSRVTQDMSK